MIEVWIALVAVLVPLVTAITALVVALKANGKVNNRNKTH